jgi:head-tail adaptor
MKKRMFDLGKMRHRIKVYATNRVDDGSGGFDRSDPSGADLIGEFWCHIAPVTSRERQWGEQYTELTTHIAWLRYNSLLKEGMTLRRIISDTTVDYYLERMIDPNNLREFSLLMLREGGPL